MLIFIHWGVNHPYTEVLIIINRAIIHILRYQATIQWGVDHYTLRCQSSMYWGVKHPCIAVSISWIILRCHSYIHWCVKHCTLRYQPLYTEVSITIHWGVNHPYTEVSIIHTLKYQASYTKMSVIIHRAISDEPTLRCQSSIRCGVNHHMQSYQWWAYTEVSIIHRLWYKSSIQWGVNHPYTDWGINQHTLRCQLSIHWSVNRPYTELMLRCLQPYICHRLLRILILLCHTSWIIQM